MIPEEPFPGYFDEESGKHINGKIYVVTNVDSDVPNHKSDVSSKINGISSSYSNEFTHVHVVPFGEYDYYVDPPIFWYINFEALSICQHESGTPIQFIDNLEIIGHDDRYNRSSAPSPCFDCDDCSGSGSDTDYEYEENVFEDEDEDTDYTTLISNYGKYSSDYNFNDGDY